MRPARQQLAYGLVVLGGAWLALGCEGMNQNEDPSGAAAKLRPMMVSQFPDVPVPMGFELVEQSSGDYTTATTRFISHERVGKAPKSKVADFYIETLQLSQWQFVADATVAGERNLLFQKTDDWCHVTLKRDEKDKEKTILRIWVMTLTSPVPEALKR